MYNSLLKIMWRCLILIMMLLPLAAQAYHTIESEAQYHINPAAIEHQGNLFLIEGDIIVAEQNHADKSAVVITTAGGKRWPKGVMPFKINKNMPIVMREQIYQAMIEIMSQSQVRFKEIDTVKSGQDFVSFEKSGSSVCSSYVGRKGGKQNIILAPRCKKGSMMHEILHALGFWHEQSRADRDNYIKVMWQNITEEKKYNFSKHIKNGIDVNDYDYGSIMHYGAKAFSKNGEATIVPLVADKVIGQRTKLSQLDVKALNTIYPKQ